jgi:hypothetical protein
MPRAKTMERPSGFQESQSRCVVSQGALRDPGLRDATPLALVCIPEALAEVVFRSFLDRWETVNRANRMRRR